MNKDRDIHVFYGSCKRFSRNLNDNFFSPFIIFLVTAMTAVNCCGTRGRAI